MTLERIPEVVQAFADSDATIVVYFDDGRIKRFDASGLLRSGGVFAPLRDPAVFRGTMTVLNRTVAWDLEGTWDATRCIDIDPVEIWLHSPDIEEPEPLRSLGARLVFR